MAEETPREDEQPEVEEVLEDEDDVELHGKKPPGGGGTYTLPIEGTQPS